ncbi:hypothetical protein DFQ09_102596 [Winogradskyella pacifica]|uniref:Cthe-2314-like HEPN domain-containing protein n=1 Tax=Winogradskyella pacifica TaxID=664642 RepID=A0A3D9N4W3_9FLAO|nr:hypothetical protein [Winogradskyella pacifica]REE26004.1 hypothetical protein DFQ09_102596 [Winogradskyella pacifica]
MSYLKELEELSQMNMANEDYNYAQRMIMVEMIQEKIIEEKSSDDYFIRFFEDVIKKEIDFDFKSVLSQGVYKSASEEAEACINVFPRLSEMKSNRSVLSWLVTALKYTDQLVLHYIQNVLNINPIKHNDHGVERSMYIQINTSEYSAHVAGSLLNNLYEQRNKLEHRYIKDPKNEDKKILLNPDFGKARKKIQSSFPKALLSFKKAYKEHYE